MNDSAIKNYAIWARRELIAEVAKRCTLYGILEKDSPSASADAIDGRVLTGQEKTQRAEVLRMLASEGYEQLVEKAAYTWFNRLLAIRFMEVNDRLPSHVRVLSAADGAFKPQALTEALDLPLDGMDRARAAQLVQSGDDEALFRMVFLAQCDELASCMPAVFDHVGSAMELLLPDGLMRQGGVVEQLVTAIPESDWTEGVEIVGWMYQYYVSERKDQVFASFKKGKKAERDAIAPATQLFTPNWIVRYLTENSLGRLWVLNNPESSLPEKMPYFVKPGDDAETEYKRVESPEDITVVDPACGSGHILVYAFELMAAMYSEAGYSDRDAASLILEKNVSGMEIDPRAAAMASFCLTMKACELDGRFLRRGVSPRITVLNRVELDSEDLALCPATRSKLDLIDAAAHLDECGSLLKPSADDLNAIARDLASLAGGNSLFASATAEKLQRLQAELEPLAARYDVVVANPPYMGSSSLGKWMGKWIKVCFPEAYRDLCTSFIDRGFTLSCDNGYSAMVTMQSWMFLGSYEKLRGKILRNHTISSMAHLGTRAFGAIGGEVVSTTATIFANKKYDTPGTYLRLVDMGSEQEKAAGALEALAGISRDFLYCSDAANFGLIPGTPIAYWVPSSVFGAFSSGNAMEHFGNAKQGIIPGNVPEFVRCWHEVSNSRIGFNLKESGDIKKSQKKWFPYNKGGSFRRWYGNIEHLLNMENDGYDITHSDKNNNYRLRDPELYFKPALTWSKVSSGSFSMRKMPSGCLFDIAGCCVFDLANPLYILGFCNSSVASSILDVLSPTLNYEVEHIKQLPIIGSSDRHIENIVSDNIQHSETEWNSFEESWGFLKHPLT